MDTSAHEYVVKVTLNNICSIINMKIISIINLKYIKKLYFLFLLLIQMRN